MNISHAIPVLALGMLTILCSACAASDAAFEAQTPEQYRDIPLFDDDAGITRPVVEQRSDPEATDAIRASSYRSAIVEAVIDESGRVVDAWYFSGDPVWGQAVAVAVRQWRFTPATQNGRPVAVRYRINSTFRSSR